MLSPFDDYPVHQTSQPIAHAGGGHPDHYDRFWFNGYTEDLYFAVALGLYPNRGIIDAAFSDLGLDPTLARPCQHPGNVWSLHGYHECLQRLGRTDEAAISVVHDGVQRSVFASGRIPLDRSQTRIGPISIEIVEPLRVNRVRVDAPDHGLVADLVARARTPACEEAPAARRAIRRVKYPLPAPSSSARP